MNAEEDVLTADEAAKFLRVSRLTLVKLAQAKKLPSRKVGRQWRFSRGLLDAWIKGQKLAH